MKTELEQSTITAAVRAEPGERKVDWRILAVLALAGLSIPIWRVMHSSRVSTGSSAVVVRVAVVKPKREDLARELTVQAEFRPFQEVDLHSKVAGFLQSIDVDVGDHVEKGQELAILEVPELVEDLKRAAAVEARAAEEVKRAQAGYREFHSASARLDAVSKSQPRLIAAQDLEAAQVKDEQASSTLAAARQAVEIARAESSKLKATAHYAHISAPFSGVITKRYADPGALIQAGVSSSTQAMPLVRLSQEDKLRLVFPVSMSYVRFVHTGTLVSVNVQNSTNLLKGTVSRISRKIETSTRTMDVEMDVPNPEGKLIPGMYASVNIELEKKPNALAVPIETVSRGKAPTVFVIKPDQSVEERSVTLGLETPSRLEVLSGIQDNDLLLIGSRSQLRPGQKVEAKLTEIE
jgi:RND family efflux transporter MFP subunit